MAEIVQVQGLSTVFKMMDDFSLKTSKRANQALQGAGIECQALAKQSCPVDKGRLRASIQYEKKPLFVTVSTNVSYSKYVEFGTVHMRARPYLYPAWKVAAQHLIEELSSL